MTRLSCGAVNCTSNRNSLCCRENIKIKGSNVQNCSETRCSSFIAQDSFASSLAPDESAPDPETEVRCDVKNCVFNISGVCSSDEITVEGAYAHDSRETQCGSFRQ